MDINRANLEALFRSYMTAFQAGLAQTPAVDISFLFREFPSTTAGNDYAWIDQVPGFREWLGDRQFQNVRSQRFTLKNRDWEDSVSMPSKDIKDDQFGVYTPLIQMMGENWPILLREIVLEVLTSNALTFTGKALCADDHPYGDQTIDNLTTAALTETTFEAARLAAAAWKFSNGKLVKPRWTHLLVGEKLRSTAYKIVKGATKLTKVRNEGDTDYVGAAEEPNPNYGACELVVLPELSGDYDDYWFLVDGSKPIKPVALQIREKPNPIADTRPEEVERSGRFDYMASGRAAAGPTFPHLIYGGIL